jgi:hypothetical protein
MAGFALSAALAGWELFRKARAVPATVEAPAPPATSRSKRGKRAKTKPAAPAEHGEVAADAAGRRTTLWLGAAIALVGAFVVGWSQVKSFATAAIDRDRNFYGVLSAEEIFADEPEYHGRALYHGRIMHGYQLADPQRKDMPTAYFHRGSGIGALMRTYPHRPRRVGVIGLGAGTLAAYAEPGDVFRFYEINPLVIDYAQKHFTFLKDCRADRLDIVPGDARISLEGEAPQEYDILVIDAFTGDAIPTHLLTREAMDLYLRHLRRGGQEGALAFHISNRYLELRPVVAALAEEAGCRSLLISDPSDDRLTIAPSDWGFISRSREVFHTAEIQAAAGPLLPPGTTPVLWTDRFSNLLGVLK